MLNNQNNRLMRLMIKELQEVKAELKVINANTKPTTIEL